ncbi:MAG: hypothetical protein KC586_01330, partial [Myxococcales bacterium]|nr:hypothetical protein [Myxococcales bacterium]
MQEADESLAHGPKLFDEMRAFTECDDSSVADELTQRVEVIERGVRVNGRETNGVGSQPRGCSIQIGHEHSPGHKTSRGDARLQRTNAHRVDLSNSAETQGTGRHEVQATTRRKGDQPDEPQAAEWSPHSAVSRSAIPRAAS